MNELRALLALQRYGHNRGVLVKRARNLTNGDALMQAKLALDEAARILHKERWNRLEVHTHDFGVVFIVERRHKR